jgi:hypothetical protein
MRKAAKHAVTSKSDTIRAFIICASSCADLLSLLFSRLSHCACPLHCAWRQSAEGCSDAGEEAILKQAARRHQQRRGILLHRFLRRIAVLPAPSVGCFPLWALLRREISSSLAFLGRPLFLQPFHSTSHLVCLSMRVSAGSVFSGPSFVSCSCAPPIGRRTSRRSSRAEQRGQSRKGKQTKERR